MIIKIFTDMGIFETKRITSVNISSERGLPFISCEVEFLQDKIGYIAKEIEVYFKGENIFSGVVDFKKQSIDEKGYRVLIRSRTKIGSLIYDNKAKPHSYINVTLFELIANHLASYGITKNSIMENRRLPAYHISINDSEWDVISRFCKIIYGEYPLISGNEITMAEDNFSREFTLSNVESGKNILKYTTVELENNYKNIVSKAITIDDEGKEVSYESSKYGYINKKKYLSSGSFVNIFPQKSSKEYVENSIKESFSASLEIPGIVDISIFDKIILKDFAFFENIFKVVKVEKIIKNKIFTRIKLGS